MISYLSWYCKFLIVILSLLSHVAFAEDVFEGVSSVVSTKKKPHVVERSVSTSTFEQSEELPWIAKYEDYPIAKVVVINKQAAISKELKIPVNTSMTFEKLTIFVSFCRVYPHDFYSNHKMSVIVRLSGDNGVETIFDDVMFANMKNLHTLEHNVYAILPIECISDKTKE